MTGKRWPKQPQPLHPPQPLDPTDGPLDHPPAWQHLETLLLWVALNDFEHRIQVFTDPVDEFSRIAAVCPELAQV